MAELVGNQSMPIDSALRFSHPQLETDLVIRSGANSIKWSYELNTLSTPTLGGEVVQILSCFVGPITIEGMAAGYPTDGSKRLPHGWAEDAFTPTDEVQSIIRWFLKYMHLAGGLHGDEGNRNQAAIKFSYPARGWDFWIQVTGLQGFDFANDQVGVPWSITAEIVSDAGLDYFEAATMNTFTDSLTERILLHTAITPGFDFGQNPFVNPTLANPAMNDIAQRLGDNFQSLVASWAGSNFMTWGFNPLGDPGDINKEDPYSVWNRLLGGEYIGEIPSGGYTDYLGTPFNVAVEDDGTGGGSEVVGSASSPKWALDVLSGLGYQATQENVCFMKSWQRAEGGHTNNTAKWNYLNVTTPMPGSSSAGTSQASIQKYPSYEVGIAAQVKTIRNGNYPDILAGLESGNILTNWSAVVNDLNIWHGAGNTNSPTTYTNNLYNWTKQCVAAALAKLPTTTNADYGPAVRGGTAVSMLRMSHHTSGVPNSRAVDIMGTPGDPVFAPEDMTITDNDATGAQGGGRARAVGKSGVHWWLGHLTGGRTGFFKKGDQFSTMADLGGSTHIHVGIDATPVIGRPLESGASYESQTRLAAMGIKTVGQQLGGD